MSEFKPKIDMVVERSIYVDLSMSGDSAEECKEVQEAIRDAVTELGVERGCVTVHSRHVFVCGHCEAEAAEGCYDKDGLTNNLTCCLDAEADYKRWKKEKQ